MSFDDEWPDQTWENRRLMVGKTIRPVSLDELKKLGEKRFPIVTDPWAIRFFEFITQNPDDSYFIAESPEHAEIIYCRESGKGIWFLPGKGMGIIQPNGLKLLAEIVAKL